MLYQLYETQRALMSPFAEFAGASAKLYSHPLSPFAHGPMAHRVSAGLDLMHRLAKDYEKPEFGIRGVEVDGIEVAVQELVPVELPFCRLLRFKRYTDDLAVLAKMKDQPTVLVVAPLSGHHSTLLRDTVRQLLKDHKVFITDWTDARMVPLDQGAFHLDDYIAYVQQFIRHIGAAECHVISVCQPTVPVLAAVSLMASRGETTPITMTMMGGPIDARRSPTTVNNLATNRSYEWFENNVIFRVPDNFPGAGRRVYPGFLQYTGFVAMNPDRHATSHYDYFKDLIKGDDASAEAHRKFYDEYNAVLDMDADYYLETIKTVFQDYNLVHGTWDVRSPTGKIERVRPQDITTTALFTVEGELDDISGSGQTEAAHDLCTGIVRKEQHHLEAKGAGHYGIFSGRRWRDVVYPRVHAFIQKHDAPLAAKSAASTAVANVASEPVVAASAAPAPSTPAPVVAAPVSASAAAPASAQTVSASPVKRTVKAAAATPKVAPSTPAAVAKPKAVQAAIRANASPAGVATRWVNTPGTETASTGPTATNAAVAKTSDTARARASAPAAKSTKRPAARKA